MMKSTSIRQPFSPYFKSVKVVKAEDGDSRQIDFRQKSTILAASLIAAAVVFCLIMIIVGSLHADRSFSDSFRPGVIHTSCSLIEHCGCHGQPLIPWYLIIAGILTILFLVGRILICRLCTKDVSCCELTYLCIYDLIIWTLSLIWISVGTHYVSDLSQRLNYSTHNPNQDTCDFGLYWFSVAVLILGWMALCLCLGWIINKYARTVFNCITCDKYGY